MPKAGFYAVRKGFKPGVYATWEECESNTKGFSGAAYKKFKTLREAEQYVGVLPITTSATETHFTPTDEPPSSPSTSAARPSSSKPYDRSTTTSKGKEKEPTPQDEAGWTIAYTDGACQGNGNRGAVAGIGVWYGPSDSRNLSERCPGDQTNNRAELIAIIRCLETDPDPSSPLIIKTDSKYAMNCVGPWFHSWSSRGWRTVKGGAVKNKEVIQHLVNLLHARPGKHKIRYVKGHAGEEGNEGADRLAVQGTTGLQQTERVWNTGDGWEHAASRTTMLASVEVDMDFPLLSDEEMERMAREQDFD